MMYNLLATIELCDSAVLMGSLVIGLLHCFGGYVLFRLAVAVDGLLVGYHLGGLLLEHIRPGSSSMDMYVASAVVGVLCLLLAWYVCRLIFSVMAGLGVTLLIVHCLQPVSPGGAWGVGILAGLVVLSFCLVRFRQLVMLVTAATGAFAMMYGLSVGWLGWPNSIPQLLADHLIGGAILIVAGVGLSLAGYWVQSQSPFFCSDRYAPPRKGRRKGPQTANVNPPFSRR